MQIKLKKMKVLFIGLTPQADLLELDKFKASSPLFPEVAKNNISPVPMDEEYRNFFDNNKTMNLTIYDLIGYIEYIQYNSECVLDGGISMFELEVDNVEEITNMIDALSTNYLTGYKVRDKVCMEFFDNLPYLNEKNSYSIPNYDKIIEVSILEPEQEEGCLVGIELLSVDHIDNFFAKGSRKIWITSGEVNKEDLLPLFDNTEIKADGDSRLEHWEEVIIYNKETLALITGYGWFFSYITGIECINVTIKLEWMEDEFGDELEPSDMLPILDSLDYSIFVDIHAD